MPTIDEIRKQYPQYGDMSDKALADAMHEKFYSDMPREQFDAKIEFQQRGAVDKLFGLTGERYQTWPERLVRDVAGSVEEGAELTKSALTGEYGPTGQGVLEESPGKILSAASLGVSPAPEAAEMAGGIVDMASKAKQTRAALPETEAIKKSADVSYKQLSDARLIAHEQTAHDLVSATRAGLDDRLITDQIAPRSYKALEQLEKSGGDVGQIMATYKRLGDIKPNADTEFTAALHIKDAINDYIEKLDPKDIVQGDPKFTATMWDHAKASWRSYAQLDQIETALEVGRHEAAVAGTGANTQNKIRQRIRAILDSDKLRGLSPKAKEQMENIVMGTWVTNGLRWAGKYAPSGPVSAITTTMAALMGDLSGGRGAAMASAAAVAIPATIAKYLGTYLTRRQVSELENIIRAESPLGQAATKGIEEQPVGVGAKALTAATPALVPGAASALAQPPIEVGARPGYYSGQ